jgi:hypothetical protein
MSYIDELYKIELIYKNELAEARSRWVSKPDSYVSSKEYDAELEIAINHRENAIYKAQIKYGLRNR